MIRAAVTIKTTVQPGHDEHWPPFLRIPDAVFFTHSNAYDCMYKMLYRLRIVGRDGAGLENKHL